MYNLSSIKPVENCTLNKNWSKINKQPLKRFLSLTVSWVKTVKTGKILTFKVNCLCQTYPNLSNFFFIEEYDFRGTLCYWHFLKTSIFRPLYFRKWRPIFEDFYSTECKTQKLFNGLVVGFGMPGIERATLFVKSEVILMLVSVS